MSSTPSWRHPATPQRGINQSTTATASLRQLLESMSREQRSNQELLVSLGFALRSFSNLNRFLELVPVVAARLVGVQGSLLVPFQADGRLWRDQLQMLPGPRTEGLLRALAAHEPGNMIGFGSDESLVLAMDRLVQRQLGSAGLFATSLIARGRPRGRLYVFNPSSPLAWSDVYRRHVQLVADLTGVAIENDLMLQEARRHERVDRQLSIGADIQAQLLPDHCPVIGRGSCGALPACLSSWR